MKKLIIILLTLTTTTLFQASENPMIKKIVGNSVQVGAVGLGAMGFWNFFKNSIPAKILFFPFAFTCDVLINFSLKSLGEKGSNLMSILEKPYRARQVVGGSSFSALAYILWKKGKEIKNSQD